MSPDNARSTWANRSLAATKDAAPSRVAVALLSQTDRTGGGASVVAEDLTRLLVEAGCRAEHWLVRRGGPPRPFQRPLAGPVLTRILARLRSAQQLAQLPDVIPWDYLLLSGRLARFDIVHVHEITASYSPLSVRWIARRKPTVWTFHDCSPFTGGCFYPFECTAFHRRCGGCPQRDRFPFRGILPFDFSGRLQDVKRATAREGNFAAVTPSQWMADEAMRSGMFTTRPRVIPNWVDSDVFRPQQRPRLRQELGLKPDAFWVLISAAWLDDRRKGIRHAIEALHGCGRPVHALIVGREDPEARKLLAGVPLHVTGFVAEAAPLARWYAAADVLLFPTLADNLPCTLLETMATATPAIASDVGGVPELIEHMANGYLAEPRSADRLAAGLRLAYDDPQVRQRWGEEGRRRAVTRHSRAGFVAAHLELYQAVIAARRDGAGDHAEHNAVHNAVDHALGHAHDSRAA